MLIVYFYSLLFYYKLSGIIYGDQLQDVNGFRNLARIHEHDFVGEKTSIICSTCGLRYCEKCGKLA
jgi:hypothetical protein